jgi:tRNA A-37 threonylcarbamoyl transferase component Bud32
MVLLIAALAYVNMVQLDPRDDMKPASGFRIFTDPPGAEIRKTNYTGVEDDLLGITNDKILTVQDFLKPGEEADENWAFEVKLRKEGYETSVVEISAVASRQRVFPDPNHPVISLSASNPIVLFGYVANYRTLPGLFILLSLLGLGASLFFMREERRKRKVLERYEADPDADSFRGKFLHGFYVTEVLGTGGFGKVYRVLDGKTLDEKNAKAMKVVSYEKFEVDDKVEDEVRTAVEQALQTAKDRFMSEMDTLVTSDHPNIYKVFTFGREEGHDWVVMPIYDGSLYDLLAKPDPIPPARVLSIARQIAAGLQYAHDREITHRDMKPDNVMFLGDEVKLIDFGIAKPKNRATLTAIDSIVGTAKYIAPEQIMGNSNVAIDQYAYGLMLFELLTRKFPYKLPMGDLMIINQRLTEDPAKLTDVAPEYSKELQSVISKMLANDPAQRYNCVKDAYDAFEKVFLANTTVTELTESKA